MLAKQVDFNQVTQFYQFPSFKVVKKRLRYLNRSLKYWLNKILSQLLWRLIGKRQINRGILSNFCCLLGKPKLLMTHFYGFSFFCEFFAKKFKKVKTGTRLSTRSWKKYRSFLSKQAKYLGSGSSGQFYCMSHYIHLECKV